MDPRDTIPEQLQELHEAADAALAALDRLESLAYMAYEDQLSIGANVASSWATSPIGSRLYGALYALEALQGAAPPKSDGTRWPREAAGILADQLAHIHEQRPATIAESDQLRTLRIYAAGNYPTSATRKLDGSAA